MFGRRFCRDAQGAEGEDFGEKEDDHIASSGTGDEASTRGVVWEHLDNPDMDFTQALQVTGVLHIAHDGAADNPCSKPRAFGRDLGAGGQRHARETKPWVQDPFARQLVDRLEIGGSPGVPRRCVRRSTYL